MAIYLFRLSSRRNIVGFTSDKSGENLPTNDKVRGHWVFSSELKYRSEEESFLWGGRVKDIIEAVKQNGYYIFESSVEITETIVKNK